MAELKTQKNDASVTDFLNAVENEKKSPGLAPAATT